MSFLALFLKGVLMGAADIVPGVSGGTIAFITGIYQTLIDAIKAINLIALKILLNEGVYVFWRYVNGKFLLPLFLGVLFSFFTLAKLFSYLLEVYPEPLWALFFGLVLASAIYMASTLTKIGMRSVFFILFGFITAWCIVSLTPVEVKVSLPYIFICGSVAICAMILPGISGSFILLILGAYLPVLTAIKNLDMTVILVFASGCAIGILCFSHFLSWLLHRFYEPTIALLIGFLLGSLKLLWPWKYVSAPEAMTVPIKQNVWPSTYETLVAGDPYLLMCLVSFVIGLVSVFVISWYGKQT